MNPFPPNFIILSKLHGFGFILCILYIFFVSCQDDASSEPIEGPAQIDAIITEDYVRPPYRMGYLNSEFEEEIPAQYDEVRNFSEGRAAVNVKGFWGFIDTLGKSQIPPKYLGSWSFSSGVAKVQSAQNRKLGFVGLQGDTLIPIEYDDARSAVFDLIPLKEGQYWGLKTLSNEVVIPFNYYDIKILSAKTAALKVTEDWMIMNIYNQDTIAENLSAVYDYTKGIIRVKNTNGKYRYLDTMGKAIFSQGANLAYAPQNGVFVRCMTNDGCQLFDDQEQPLSDIYERIRPLGMGRFAFYENEKWGLMDELGATILPPQFDQLYGFSAGFAPYLKDKLWGYINLNGDRTVDNNYGLAYPFHNGFARVLSRKGMAFLDTDLEVHLIPSGISDVRSFSQGQAAFKRPTE